ncbi:MAG: S-methyl-5-thioribose-1-phosphate isomerase [Elusimicrobia bacterium]|nr:S-methyl-5-thioribose-1-phosphate isomerase [Elusimicrobiota bacterium]MBD3412331.1 S-methyl-5-thioribose-1-phosphate isomerase [Elusimicrobiota bacterium]
MVRTLYWRNNSLYILDQKRLPGTVVYRQCRSAGQVAECIRHMIIRGAPAIGVAAAYGIVCALIDALPKRNQHQRFKRARNILASSRPTAVNLFWALQEMETIFHSIHPDSRAVRTIMLREADRIYRQDIATNKAIGSHGSKLLRITKGTILTHCNAGALATAGWGTALGVIRTAYQHGKIKTVYVDETRPYLQGARLTAWELVRDNIPVILITDSMAGAMMQQGLIDAVVVGADRITLNGDVANKIGTYGLAVLARYHRVPFYVAAPTSTFDMKCTRGCDIPIEERSAMEVTQINRVSIAPRGIHVRHPAFDVTPARLVTALITECGAVHKPNKKKILKHINS